MFSSGGVHWPRTTLDGIGEAMQRFDHKAYSTQPQEGARTGFRFSRIIVVLAARIAGHSRAGQLIRSFVPQPWSFEAQYNLLDIAFQTIHAGAERP